jgi:hypothetical protein
MTDAELRAAAIEARKVANALTGPMHAWWDLIFDIEAILKGEKSISSREKIEQAIKDYHLL